MLALQHLMKSSELVSDLAIDGSLLLVQDVSSFALPSGDHFYATLKSGNSVEHIKVVNVDVNGVWTIERAVDGTIAKAWTAGACVLISWNPSQIREAVALSVSANHPVSGVEAGEYCLDQGSCLTIDAYGHVTAVNTGNNNCA